MIDSIKPFSLEITALIGGFLPLGGYHQSQIISSPTPKAAVIASPSPIPSPIPPTIKTTSQFVPTPAPQVTGGSVQLRPDYAGGYIGYDNDGNQIKLHSDGAGGYIGQDVNGNQIRIPAGQYRANDSNDNSYQLQPQPTPYSYTYPTPTPQPIYQPTNKTCTTSGNYTNCSDGSSYMTNGGYTTVNGGANEKSGSCITSGGYTNCSDGSSAIKSGNSTFINGTV